MEQNIINAINGFKTFKYDQNTKRVINMKFQEDTDIDEFLSIQFILDNSRVKYKFDKNFDIQVFI